MVLSKPRLFNKYYCSLEQQFLIFYDISKKKKRKWHQLSYMQREKSIFNTYIYSLNLINLMLSQYKVFVYFYVNFILAGISKRRKTISFNGPFNSKVDLYINMAFTSKVYEIKRFFLL